MMKYLKKATHIFVMMCVYTSCFFVRNFLGSVATESSAEDEENENGVLEIAKSAWLKNETIFHESDFVNQFRQALKSESLSLSPGHLDDGFIPFILRNGKLLCRRVHRNRIRKTTRIKAVAEMIRIGLDLYEREGRFHKVRGEFPFLLLNSDSNGCLIKKHRDNFDFPRFTWSRPAPKHGGGWCNAVPVPSYLSWKTFHQVHKSQSSWRPTFESQASEYAWSSKIQKAVWRGSTTYDTHFSGAELNETPRGQLVQKSMEHPELIDAGFFKLNQQYASREEDLINQTRLTERMEFDDMMKYKAILDIDGNNWSGRFPKLLCTNSVIIKV